MVNGTDRAPLDAPPAPADIVADVGVGRRVMVVSDLLIKLDGSPISPVVRQFARTLESWRGPGLLVIAGNLFDLSMEEGDGCAHPDVGLSLMEAMPVLMGAFSEFLAGDDRRIIRLLGVHEIGAPCAAPVAEALSGIGIEHGDVLDLRMETALGSRTVRVEPGDHEALDAGAVQAPEPTSDTKPGVVERITGAQAWRRLVEGSSGEAPWLVGVERLSDPAALSRFVSSRTLYRRIGRFGWWIPVPFVLAVMLRALVQRPWLLRHTGHGAFHHWLVSIGLADWGDRIVFSLVAAVVVFVILAAALGLVSRRLWSALGGGTVAEVQERVSPNDAARDRARALLHHGFHGFISAATFRPELSNLGTGFFANVGATAEVVEEERGRFGLPPVFVHRNRVSWVELETGADLHARLLLAETDIPSPSIAERLAVALRVRNGTLPAVVASYPNGESWPPAPDLRRAHRRTRRIRRLAAAGIILAGLIDMLDAVTPPLRTHLRMVLNVLPLQVNEAAGALLALAGMAFLALGRGILRGQRRPMRIAIGLLGTSVILHLLAGQQLEETVFALAVMVLLIVNRREFQGATDFSSLRSGVLTLVVGSAISVAVAAGAFFGVSHLPDYRGRRIGAWEAIKAACERLVGIRTIQVPRQLDHYVAPSLLVIGLTLVAVALFLVSRPVVDRRLVSGKAAELRARDIVRRHGASTLDYFALRSDKRWFFHRDSVVAYAIYGGICLISPDPIGPHNEREQVWGAFRRFVDEHGWIPAVMGAGEEWLAVYASTGMHNVYLGDEAVVDVQRFSLAGGDKKGLRQAYNRIGNKGYTVEFHDPARIDRHLRQELNDMMGLSRRGEHERGFSMMLGRIFDPSDTGLLLTVVKAPDGRPAAMCQFVPSTGIDGFSLDLMRRDTAEHPNGLIDFALCATIEHLAGQGYHGLSLNFATMRQTLAGERGDGTVQRSARWVLKRLSNFAQIESLWKFNAKYDPEWLPRFVVFDTAEHLVPVVMAILRAEAVEFPLLGRFLAASASKRYRDAEEELAARDAAEEIAARAGDGEHGGPGAAGSTPPTGTTRVPDAPNRS